MKKYKKVSIYIVFFIFLILIDQLFKHFFINKEFNIILELLKIKYIENNGVAFGLFNSRIALIADIIIIIVIIIYWVKSSHYIIKDVSLTIILAGSIGNLIDRLFRGYVIDFIKITSFSWVPIINFADIYILLGLIIFIITNIKSFKESSEN